MRTSEEFLFQVQSCHTFFIHSRKWGPDPIHPKEVETDGDPMSFALAIGTASRLGRPR